MAGYLWVWICPEYVSVCMYVCMYLYMSRNVYIYAGKRNDNIDKGGEGRGMGLYNGNHHPNINKINK